MARSEALAAERWPAWPAEMRSATAAAYVDEPSVEAFLGKVAKGVYCEPAREHGCMPKWNREKLDIDIRRRHRVRVTGAAIVEDIEHLV